MKEFRFTPALLEEIYQHAFTEAPSECCGWVIKNEDGSMVYFKTENMQDKYHALDPELYPRTSKEAFMMNTKKLSTAIAEAAQSKAVLYSIVHSHVDVGAYFSAEDKLQMSNSEKNAPVYPAENFLVVAVKDGKKDTEAVFYYDYEKCDFLPGKIVV